MPFPTRLEAIPINMIVAALKKIPGFHQLRLPLGKVKQACLLHPHALQNRPGPLEILFGHAKSDANLPLFRDQISRIFSLNLVLEIADEISSCDLCYRAATTLIERIQAGLNRAKAEAKTLGLPVVL